MLALLLTLGTWQYKRLQWKTALLTEIDAAATASPLTTLRDIENALADNEPIDYRRVSLSGEFLSDPLFYVFTPENRDISWNRFLAFQDGGQNVFVRFDLIKDAAKSQSDAFELPDTVIGYVRKAHPVGRFVPDSAPDKNEWYGFNPLPDSHSWSDKVNGGAVTAFYIDRVIGATDANALPARKPDIRNNHFDYMLTWYGLALTLLVFYVLLHRRDGRLSW